VTLTRKQLIPMPGRVARISFGPFLLALILPLSCVQEPATRWVAPPLTEEVMRLPAQPGEDRWRFIEDLKAPMWTRHPWGTIPPGSSQADLSGGIRLKAEFADPKGRLETAYEDLRRFFAAGGLRVDNGGYEIKTAPGPDLGPEAFRLEVGPRSCRLLAADPEGIRRGIVHLEDEMLRARGPYLPVGIADRRPFIGRRISRCFFGPIKRPPKLRDELMDEVDYYPEQYLNRLAHEGINGLWLTVEFRDLVSTSLTPEGGRDSERRLTKLRKTVASCLRYGIRTYLFSIEPRAWDADNPVLKRHPELAGPPVGGGRRCFCPSSDVAASYLHDSVHAIFRGVPELGGLINISHGERPTTCLSALSDMGEGRLDCPRCSEKAPWEILHASLSAMERGMHEAAPDAELISWLYMPHSRGRRRSDLADWVYEIPSHTPPGVILQFNFESGVRRTEFGKELVGGDYWISNPGPSPRFDRIATLAKTAGTAVSAKIQTACSHEVATVPEVPVPSLLYRKFSEMKRLGVSHTMLCWYFGNHPGLMNKAAGLLSVEPFPKDEETFLERLAAIDWGEKEAPAVVRAWKHFSEGYEHYPLSILFQYYGPMHDGPVWPLLLSPQDAPLAPTWLLASTETRAPWPPSGDRIGECILEALTLDELVELTRRMSASWDQGVETLRSLEPSFKNEPERLLDIGVARALGIQFRCGHNILRFYLLREKMLLMEGKGRLELLEALGNIVREELDLDEQLLALCERDSRLGFHSEAEGYKYFPEKIRWRMRQLENVLNREIPTLDEAIREGKFLFPEYTGKRPEGVVAYAVPCDNSVWSRPELNPPENLRWQPLGRGLRWAAGYDAGALYVIVANAENAARNSPAPALSQVLVKIEPRRLWPSKHFLYVPGGEPLAELPDTVAPQAVDGRVAAKSDAWCVVIRIPLGRVGLVAGQLHPIRLDLQVQRKEGRDAWRPSHPMTSRLNLGTDNPADLGWLLFEPRGN
jgi:hypothetical protein